MSLVDKESLADREEIDAAYLAEVQGELPETWEDVVEIIEDHGKDAEPEHEIMRWAGAFDALSECAICGTKIVQTDSLAEALADHYGLEGDEADKAAQSIESAVLNSGVETGDFHNSSLCCYHGDVMRRDD
jgi:hypothetical protein